MKPFAVILSATLVVVVGLLVSSIASASLGGSAVPAAVRPATAPTYSVTFNETGLPAGTNWGVHYAYIGCSCNGPHKTVKSTSSSITVSLPNGSYQFRVQRVDGYFVNVSASGILNVSGAAVAPITFVFYPVIPFLVEFTESGLPNGTLWTVSLHGNGHGQEAALQRVTETSYGTSMNFSLLNGTYHYTVEPVAGSFFTGPSHGKFVIAGASIPPIAVGFETPPAYTLSFVESGLPAGANWSARVASGGALRVHDVSSTTSNEINFSLPAGTYRYALSEVLGFAIVGSVSGSVTLAPNGSQINVTYQSLAPGAFYVVTFNETGLANGSHWSVGVTATHTFGHSRHEAQTSNTTTLQFLLQNGTYRYHANRVRGYEVANDTGTFVVAGGSPATIVLNYSTIPTYTVTISETGLPNGTNWTVVVHTQGAFGSAYPVHTSVTSNGTSVTFQLPNGAYCYRIAAVAGYHVTTGKKNGSFSVADGAPAPIPIGFSPKG